MTWRELFIAVFGISLLAVALAWIGKWNGEWNERRLCQVNLRAIGQVLSGYSQTLKLSHLPDSLAPLPDFVHRGRPQRGSLPTDESIKWQRNRDRRFLQCPLIERDPAGEAADVYADYAFPAAGMKRLDQLPPEMVVVYESACRHRGGMNVLFASGTVRWLNAKESANMLTDLAAGKNPPPSLNSKK